MTFQMEHALDTKLHDILPMIQRRIMENTTYFGIRTLKNPMDFWVYQEIIYEMKPDFIVELGNSGGGSALALGHMLDLLGHGRLIGVDINHSRLNGRVRAHPRLDFIEADALEAFEEVRKRIPAGAKTLVIEDSAHTFDVTLGVLRLYSTLVQPGHYVIIEDTICHHGLDIGPNPGPYEAVNAFLAENADFEHDRAREDFCITWNPKGFLRRKPGQARV